jgi:hypothetical protein
VLRDSCCSRESMKVSQVHTGVVGRLLMLWLLWWECNGGDVMGSPAPRYFLVETVSTYMDSRRPVDGEGFGV